MTSPALSFRAQLQLDGKTATGIRVPDEIVQQLGGGKRVPVVVSFSGHTYRSSIMARADGFKLPVSAEQRAGAGVKAGDEIEVTVASDSAPREVAVPEDLRVALDADPAASSVYAKLSYSKQRAVVEPIEAAKTRETRQRRIEKAIERLREGRDR